MTTKEDVFVFLRLKANTEKEHIARRIKDVSEIFGVCLGLNEVLVKTGIQQSVKPLGYPSTRAAII